MRFRCANLDRARNFIGTQATGAGVDTFGRAINNCLYTFYIRFPSTVTSPVGVGNLNSERYTLTADFTFSHGLHLLERTINQRALKAHMVFVAKSTFIFYQILLYNARLL